MEHAGLPVHGYQKQADEKVQLVNRNKEIEEHSLRVLDALRDLGPAIDQRWLAIGRTHLEQAWMAINRSIFQPQRFDPPSAQPSLPLDDSILQQD